MNVWLIAAMSADGKIAQRADQSSLDWTSPEDTRFFIEKTKEAGVVIMGAKTFETIGKPLKGRRVIVMSHDPTPLLFKEGKGVVTSGTVEFTSLEPSALLNQLSSEGVESVVIGGGASVYSQFLTQGLVTDLYLTIEPLLFGNGLPIASGFDRIDLRLADVKRLGEQAVLLHYKLG